MSKRSADGEESETKKEAKKFSTALHSTPFPSPPATPDIVSADEWAKARQELLRKEKAATHALDEAVAARRALPWKEVEDYKFTGLDGESVQLSELFDGKDTLVLYHMMYGTDEPGACPSCTMWVHTINGMAPYLRLRVSLAVVGKAAVSKLKPYAKAQKWTIPVLSSHSNTFNRDFAMEHDNTQFYGGQNPGLSVFFLRDGKIYLTYSCTQRGLDIINNAHQVLDMTPAGRQSLSELLHSPPTRPFSD